MAEERLELCTIGKYDIPSKQRQSLFQVDLIHSNIAIFGSALSGKTNLLKLLINCLHKRSNEKNEQIFILDFSGALREYKDMPLVSAYFDNSNEEYVKRVFRIMETILKKNTKDLGSKNFAGGRSEAIPHTTFILDNLNAFIDEMRYSAYHEKFGRLCRDGRSRGISIVFAATDTKGLNGYMLSFEQKIALNFSTEKCTDLFGIKTEALGNITGRGYANVTERPDGIIGTFNLNAPYEVQILKCADIADEDSPFVQKLRAKYGFNPETRTYERTVKKYQTFPQELLWEDYNTLKQPYASDDKIPSAEFAEVGLDYVDFKPVGVDFADARVTAIYGKREFGKTNLLTLLLDKLAEIKKASRFVLFDDGRKQLRGFYEKLSKQAECRYIGEFAPIDVKLADGRTVTRKLSPMLQFYKLLHEEYISLSKDYRDNPILDQIYGVDDEKIMVDDIPKGCERGEASPTVFVIQSQSVYLNTKTNADFIHYVLPELLDIAEDNDLIFLFTDVKKINDQEVNSEFNSSLKTVFLLDNIAEFASERGGKSVFGDMDQKTLKEDYARCEIGDGYYYNVEADLLKKAKFIKVI